MKKLDNKKQLPYYEKHSSEFTRRQFLYNSGMTSVASYLALANLPQIFASNAYAQSTNGQNLAYVSLDCMGGINLAGNVIMGRDSSGTQYETGALDSYLYMGLTADLHPKRSGMVDKSFGLEFHKTSGILIGMKQVLDGKTVVVNGTPVLVSDMVDGLVMAYRSTDDTSENPLNTSIPAVRAGANGKLANLIGNQASSNGGNSITDPFVFDPVLRPPKIENSRDAKNLSSLGAFMNQNGNRSQYTSFMNTIANASRKRLEMISQSRLPANARANIERSMSTMTKAGPFFDTFTPAVLDPMQTDAADLNKVFPDVFYPPRQFQSNLSRDLDTIGTMSYLLLHDNLVGSVMLAVGGGDYHDGTAMTGVLKDLELGRYIGEIIYYAALKERNVVIDLYTDGSAICDPTGVMDESMLGQGRVIHVSDSPVQSGSIMLSYRHGKTRVQQPIIKKDLANNSLRQVGHFLPGKGGGVALTANSMANDITMVWKIKMLNYIAMMENTTDLKLVTDKFEAIFGRGLLAADAASMIRFNYLG
ncbi:MAG TPA: hypothetical protein VNJ01_15165 [Bacteriovoracaceae bacterium]|nr:hypothetical protein [Bacteriovoracaceae bacterium]